MTEKSRKRGRPTDAETYGAAVNPLAKLMKKMAVARVRIDVGPNGVRRKSLGKAYRKPKTAKPFGPEDRRVSVSEREIDRVKQRKAAKKASRAPKVLGAPPIVTAILPNPDTGKPEKVPSRPSHRDVIRKWRCMDGIHIDMFVSDYEMVGRDLSAASFDPTKASGGGKPTPFPERKIDAARRLAELRQYLAPGQYDLVVAVVVHGVTVTHLHAAGAEQHVVARQEVRDALNSMASFYTPGRLAKKRTWEAATKIVQELERSAK